MTDSLELNRTQLCQLLGVSLATLRAAVAAGAPGVIGSGGRGKAAKIRAPEFVQWWVEQERRKVDTVKRDSGTLSQRDQQLDIELKEEKLRGIRREVVDRAAAGEVIRGIMATCAMVIRQAPRRYGHQFVQLPDMAAAVDALTSVAEDQCASLRVPGRWSSLSASCDDGHEGLTSAEG